MKIGILGGSFDPIHNGHVHMALAACDHFALDQVWLIPAGHSPNKDEQTMTDAKHRYQMCEIAAKSDPRLVVSSIEIDSNERSYTYRTLQKLAQEYPDDRFYFIMGGDSLDYFERWVYPEIITKLCTILVMPRKPFHKDVLLDKIQKLNEIFSADIRLIDCDEYPISSTEIRKQLLQATPAESDFPEGVLDYIRTHHLYNATQHGADYGTK